MASTPVDVKKAASSPMAAGAPARAGDPWRSFRDEMDRVFDRFSGTFGMPALRRLLDGAPAAGAASRFSFAAPSVDVAEDDTAFKITAELPGLDPKDVEVTVTGDRLVLKGEKKEETEQKEKNYYMSERSYGSFQRSFALPDGVDRDKIAADLAKGVLTVTLPKTPDAQKPSKKIEVKPAA